MQHIILVSLFLCGCGYLGKLHPVFRKVEDTEEARSFKEINCQGSNVKSLDITGPDDKVFSYKYEYFPPTNGNPTVVAIPGGPGQSSIGSKAGWFSDLPDGYGVVMTDPRGVGCNAIEPEPSDEFLLQLSSEDVARDILKAIVNESIDNYILYGISYGTVVATIAGSLAPSDNQPRAVVLEGVLGARMDDDLTKYNELLQSAISDAGSTAKTKFSAASLPLGYSESDWIGIILTLGRVGTVYYQEDKTKVNLLNRTIELATSDSAEDQQRIQNFLSKLQSSNSQETPGESVFYALIGCTEVWNQLRKTSLKDATLQKGSENLCAKVQAIKSSASYDSVNYQIKAPLYYFQGSDDPATPEATAKYHYDGQTSSSHKQYVGVTGAGHNPVQFSLSDCSKNIWSALKSPGDISATVNACGWSKFSLLSSGSK